MHTNVDDAAKKSARREDDGRCSDYFSRTCAIIILVFVNAKWAASRPAIFGISQKCPG